MLWYGEDTVDNARFAYQSLVTFPSRLFSIALDQIGLNAPVSLCSALLDIASSKAALESVISPMHVTKPAIRGLDRMIGVKPVGRGIGTSTRLAYTRNMFGPCTGRFD